MHEEELRSIHLILDFMCANKYLKYGLERYLQEHDLRFWDIEGLLKTIMKIRASVDEIDRPEVDLAIIQDLRVRINKR